MIELSVEFHKKLVDNFQASLNEMGEQGSRKLISMVLNHQGRIALTAVKRYLAQTTGIAYNAISKSVVEHKSSLVNLTYRIVGTGGPTNLRDYKPYSGASSFSAAPWGERRQFPRTFQVGGSGPLAGFVMHRGPGGAREPIDFSYGPDLAREMAHKECIAAFNDSIEKTFMPEIRRQLTRRLGVESMPLVEPTEPSEPSS
ncbi:MAG: hypothetical protein WDN46_06670 [Methylocella sp.]